MQQGANAQLRDRVQDLAVDLQEAREELAALSSLQERLAEAAPEDVNVDALIEAAVAHERAAQDSRNRKVLELLKSKVGPCTDHVHCCCYLAPRFLRPGLGDDSYIPAAFCSTTQIFKWYLNTCRIKDLEVVQASRVS